MCGKAPRLPARLAGILLDRFGTGSLQAGEPGRTPEKKASRDDHQTVKTQGDHAEETGKIGPSGKEGEEGALRGKEIDLGPRHLFGGPAYPIGTTPS